MGGKCQKYYHICEQDLPPFNSSRSNGNNLKTPDQAPDFCPGKRDNRGITVTLQQQKDQNPNPNVE